MKNVITPRKLTESDRPALERLLGQEPEYTLFFRGNLDAWGSNDPDLEYWGIFNADGLETVLMRYRYNWSAYGPESADYGLYSEIAGHHPAGVSFITGKPAIGRQLTASLKGLRVVQENPSYFCSVRKLNPPAAGTGTVRQATEEDIPALVKLYREDEMMQRDEEAMARRIREGLYYLVEKGDLIVSAACTTAETSDAAMIGGVFTALAFRNLGCASSCVYHLCQDLLAEGKIPCLFYFNPAAGSIYRKLGFTDIGPWLLLSLKREA